MEYFEKQGYFLCDRLVVNGYASLPTRDLVKNSEHEGIESPEVGTGRALILHNVPAVSVKVEVSVCPEVGTGGVLFLQNVPAVSVKVEVQCALRWAQVGHCFFKMFLRLVLK